MQEAQSLQPDKGGENSDKQEEVCQNTLHELLRQERNIKMEIWDILLPNIENLRFHFSLSEVIVLK